MQSTAHPTGAEPALSTEIENQEDWSDIWALEDPAISGADPIGHHPAERLDES